MELRCPLADPQLRGDLLVRLSAGDEAQHFALAVAQSLRRRRNQSRRHARIDVRAAAGQRRDRPLDLIQRCSLQQIALRAGADRFLDLLAVRRQHEHRCGFGQASDGLQPVHAGQFEIEKDDIHPSPCCNRLLGRRKDTGNFESALPIERGDEPFPHHGMIVHHGDPRHRFLFCFSSQEMTPVVRYAGSQALCPTCGNSVYVAFAPRTSAMRRDSVTGTTGSSLP